MSATERIQIKKEIYHWAFNESQKEEEEIINKFPKVTEWIKGDAAPTFRQLESLAGFLKIPFGYLFLETPPETDIMEAEFRSINNKIPFMSKNLKDTITAMAIKLKELKLISKTVLDEILDEGIKSFGSRTDGDSGGGGNFYNTFNTRISPTFTQAVIRSAETGDTSYSNAFRLLGGIRGRTYDEIKMRILPMFVKKLILII